jgi:hypothetical protein
MAFLKHVGRNQGTGQRLSVVFLQLPDEKENALVVYSDSLPDRYHDDFMAAVESPEGQSSKNLYEVLGRKVFWHGTTMLETLHKEGHLRKVPTRAIIMMPNSNTSVPLDDILAQMNIDDTVEPRVNDTTQTPEPSQVDTNVEESKQDENKQIAQNLLIQANLLQQDADAKRAEAIKYDPSLAPKAKAKSKVRVTTGDTPKRGRGRPKKSEA